MYLRVENSRETELLCIISFVKTELDLAYFSCKYLRVSFVQNTNYAALKGKIKNTQFDRKSLFKSFQLNVTLSDSRNDLIFQDMTFTGL